MTQSFSGRGAGENPACPSANIKESVSNLKQAREGWQTRRLAVICGLGHKLCVKPVTEDKAADLHWVSAQQSPVPVKTLLLDVPCYSGTGGPKFELKTELLGRTLSKGGHLCPRSVLYHG